MKRWADRLLALSPKRWAGILFAALLISFSVGGLVAVVDQRGAVVAPKPTTPTATPTKPAPKPSPTPVVRHRPGVYPWGQCSAHPSASCPSAPPTACPTKVPEAQKPFWTCMERK